MLRAEDTVLVVIDVQGKLAQLMHDKEELFKNIRTMILGAKALDVPILLTEQYPEGMGSTIPEIADLLDGVTPIAKTSFSCCGDDGFTEAFTTVGREQALLVGIETHICVWQTAYDLLESDYEVHVVADAVSSRKAENKHIGLENMRDSGAIMTCTETALFELLRVAEGPKFKEILKLVK